MRIRNEVIKMLVPFIRRNDFTVSDLLIMAECCIRECSGRGAISQDDVNKFMEILREMKDGD